MHITANRAYFLKIKENLGDGVWAATSVTEKDAVGSLAALCTECLAVPFDDAERKDDD